MSARYGFPLDRWNVAVEEVRQILVEVARRQGTITYSDLVARLKSIRLQPDSYALSKLLENVARREDKAGSPLLTVLVVHKTGDLRPGKGYSELAKALGRDTDDLDSSWIAELKACWEWWGVHSVRQRPRRAKEASNQMPSDAVSG